MTASINVLEILAIPIFFKSVFNQHPPPIKQSLVVQFKLKSSSDLHEFILEKSQIPSHLPEYYDSQNTATLSRIYSHIQKKDHISIKSSQSQCLRYAQDMRFSYQNTKIYDTNAVRIKNEQYSELKISLIHLQQNQQDILINANKKTAYGRHEIKQDKESSQIQMQKSYLSKKSTITSLSEVNSNSFCIKNEMSYKITGKDLVRLYLNKLQRQQELMRQNNMQFQYINCILQDQLNGKRYRIYIKYDLKYEEAKLYCGGFGASMSYTLKSLVKLNEKDTKNETKIEKKLSSEDNRTQSQKQFIDLSKKPIKSSMFQEQDKKIENSFDVPQIVRLNQIDLTITQENIVVGNSQCCLFNCVDR